MIYRKLSTKIIREYIEWREKGISNSRIASVIGISFNSLSKWITEGEKLLKSGKADETLQNRLFTDQLDSTPDFLKMKLAFENRRCIAKRIALSEAKAIESGDTKHLAVSAFLEKTAHTGKNLNESFEIPMIPSKNSAEQANENVIDIVLADEAEKEKFLSGCHDC